MEIKEHGHPLIDRHELPQTTIESPRPFPNDNFPNHSLPDALCGHGMERSLPFNFQHNEGE